MKDIARMRLGVLREIKNVRRFFDMMENSVKDRNPEAIQKAYMFLKAMVYYMNDGELTPENVELNLELARAFEELDDK